MSHYKIQLQDGVSSLDKNLKIGIIKAEFNLNYTSQLEALNTAFLESNGFENISCFTVPGALEVPGFAKKLVETGEYDLILTLGVVVRGGTSHYDHVCEESFRALMDLNMRSNTPIIFGTLTCENNVQVEERISATAAISGLNLLSEINKI